MDTITRRYQGEQCTFQVLTREEADREGLQYKPWREVQAGEYGLSDDGYVALCMRFQLFVDPHGRAKRLYTFPYGRIWDSPNARLLYLERKAVGNYSASSARSWQEVEAKRTRSKMLVKAYARQLIMGNVDYDVLGRVYRPDQQIPAATVRRLLREERIQDLVGREMSLILSRSGLTPEYVADLYAETLRMAKEKGDAKTTLAVLDRVCRLLGMLPPK